HGRRGGRAGGLPAHRGRLPAVRSASARRRRTDPARRRSGRPREPGEHHMTASKASPADTDAAREALLALRAEVGKAVVGQDNAVTGLIVALLCRGHVLIEGVPGVAKTLLVRALATASELGSTRVQFTPD